jgi:3-hydroxyisobutyrate dehydrogenase
MSRVAVIGLGRIGGGAVRAMSRGGFDLCGYDLDPDRMAAVAALAASADSPRAAGEGRDVALVAVYDDAQVREALSGPDGLLSAQTPPRVIVILSTVRAETIVWAGEQAAALGVGLLDCGVTGGSAIEEGKIAALAGGDDATFAAARDVIAGFASPVVHMGPLGSGMKAKLARNLIVFGCWYITGEALRLAAAAGVDITALAEVSDAADRWSGGPTGLLVKHGIAPAPVDPGDTSSVAARERFAGFAHKDVSAALELAAELGLELPGAVVVEREFESAVGLG